MWVELQSAAALEIAPPADRAYPGTIELRVDASDVTRGIFQVHESLPVRPGSLTLLYPEWIPGEHAPTGPLISLAGLVLTGNGERIEWQRDPVNPFAFHLSVPAGVRTLEIEFQFLSPVRLPEGRRVATPEILGLQWNTVVLYPAGYAARRITVRPQLLLPEGWQFASALEPAAHGITGELRFKETDLSTLVDSPLYAGRHFKRYDLDPGAKVPVDLDVFADDDESLEASPAELVAHRALVQQAYKLYGSHHYDHYDFLLAISDTFGNIGLEHHQSSEDGVRLGYFSEKTKTSTLRDLLSHEFTHSWNGKFRRPLDLTTANFNVPMQDSLLWVYEGQTQYWGYVLAARSGIASAALTRDDLAAVAARYENQAGRSWRSLEDTTNAAVVSQWRELAWPSWQRNGDYYSEAQLIWLDVDTRIREMSGEKRSLDDFARSFFGIDDGSHEVRTYTFEDVVAALNAVAPYDWANFLRARLDGHGPAPLEGLTRSGWRLTYTDEPSASDKGLEEERHTTNFAYSLGFDLDRENLLTDLQWDSPAFKAGLTTGAKLLAVNGHAVKADLLRRAITAAKSTTAPIDLLLQRDDLYFTVHLDYHEGLRYPHLVRIEGTPDRLGAILSPL
jgi:predicted metalloprotease with PDZ domain